MVSHTEKRAWGRSIACWRDCVSGLGIPWGLLSGAGEGSLGFCIEHVASKISSEVEDGDGNSVKAIVPLFQ